MKVTISENLGEVKVTDNNVKPLNKVYIKVFAMMSNGSTKFYKDGYTDLRGKINYLSLNTEQISSIKRFSIFIMHDDYGSIIKECDPPSTIKPIDNESSEYDNYQNYRQEVKQIWRTKNKPQQY